jgi:hypothetical protein
VGDQTQPGGGAGADRDPWAPPESRTSLEKGAPPAAPGQQPYPQDRPPAAQQPPVQPPSVHNQATVTSMPGDGFAPPPGSGTPGMPGTPPGLPGYGPPNAPGGYGPPGTPHPHSGWSESAVPPPPIGPAGPGMQGGPAMPGGYGYPAYPQGYGWPGMPMAPQNGMGTAAMVLGILSCCLFCIYGIVSIVLGVVAIILGVKGKRRADRGEATNRSQAQAGFIMGIIGTIIGIATLVSLIIGITLAYQHEKERQDSDPYYNSAPSLSAPVVVRG